MRYVLVTVLLALSWTTMAPASSVGAVDDPQFSSWNVPPGARSLVGGGAPAICQPQNRPTPDPQTQFKKIVVSSRRTGRPFRASRTDGVLIWRDSRHRSVTFDGQWFRNHTHSYVDVAAWCPRPTS